MALAPERWPGSMSVLRQGRPVFLEYRTQDYYRNLVIIQARKGGRMRHKSPAWLEIGFPPLLC